MSKKPARKSPATVVGRDIDNGGARLRPSASIIYWTGDGRSQLQPWPGELSRRNNDGTWTIIYFQRHNVSMSVTSSYSDKPRLHHWTFPEAYDDWYDELQAAYGQ